MNRFLVVFLIGLSSLAQAQSTSVYRCTGDDGVPNYTNHTQGQKNCELLSGVAVTTVPAFKPPARSATTSNIGPNDFPKVDNDLQKQRDEQGRRPILERELRDREERCSVLRRDSNNGNPLRVANEESSAYSQRVALIKTQLERCDADLTAIRREISNLK